MTIRIFKYILFFLAAYLICLYLTFPWDSVKDRVLQQLSQQSGQTIIADSLTPNWFTGFRAKNLQISNGPDAEPIVFESVYARARIMDFAFGGYGGYLNLPLGQGTVHAQASGNASNVQTDIAADEVELALVPPLKTAAGVNLSGLVVLDSSVNLGLQDPTTTEGEVALNIADLEIHQGSKLGKFPLPFSLALGSIDWLIPIQAGKVIAKNLKVRGPDVEADIDGEIILSNPLPRSQLSLIVKFKPTPALLQREKLLGALLGNIQRYKGPDGFYKYRITGTIKRPRMSPSR